MTNAECWIKPTVLAASSKHNIIIRHNDCTFKSPDFQIPAFLDPELGIYGLSEHWAGLDLLTLKDDKHINYLHFKHYQQMLHIFLQPYYCPQNKSYLNLSRNILSINNTYITTASASFPNQKWGCKTLHVPFFQNHPDTKKVCLFFFLQ